MTNLKICQVKGCYRRRRAGARGLCAQHLGEPSQPIEAKAPSRPCDVADCGRKHKAHGLCKVHYDRAAAGRPLGGPVKSKKSPNKPVRRCDVAGCRRKHKSRGMCALHYGAYLAAGGETGDDHMKAKLDCTRVAQFINDNTHLCEQCGRRFDSVCVDFDHLPGFTKTGLLSKLSGRDKLWEMNKTQPICACCHRSRGPIRKWNDDSSYDGSERPNLAVWVRGSPLDSPLPFRDN